jgi:DNA-binding NarL/FixJ family response regulator
MNTLEHPLTSVITRLKLLTHRQMQVCELVVEGLTNKEIGERLGITVHTVKVHRAEVMRQMAVESVAELVRAVVTPQQNTSTSNLIDIARPLRIVVVEDQALLRDMMTRSLNQCGHHVTGVVNGQELEAEWARSPADVLILDIELGTQENGLDIAARFRETTGCGIIIMSARGRVDDRISGLDKGADAYFTKPISFKELNAAIVNLGRRIRKL